MIGIAVCTVLFAGCFFIGEGGAVLYFNLASFAVVGAGTVGAGFLSFPYERLRIALKVARNAYRKDQVKSPDEIVKVLLDISVRSRYDGILSLEKVGGRDDDPLPAGRPGAPRGRLQGGRDPRDPPQRDVLLQAPAAAVGTGLSGPWPSWPPASASRGASSASSA